MQHVVQRGRQSEDPRRRGEEVDAVDPPILRPLLRHLELVAGEEERRLSRAFGGLHVEKPFLSCRHERQHVISSAVALLVGDPANLAGEILAAKLDELPALEPEHELLSGPAQRSVAAIALDRIEFHYQPPQGRWHLLLGLYRDWRGDEDGIWRRYLRRSRWDIDCGWIVGQITRDRFGDRALVVPRWLVAGDPGHAQFLEHGRNIFVFKLHRPAAAWNPFSQCRVVPGFHVGPARQFVPRCKLRRRPPQLSLFAQLIERPQSKRLEKQRRRPPDPRPAGRKREERSISFPS